MSTSKDGLIEDFDPNAKDSLELDKQIGIWVPEGYWSHYRTIQEKSGRRFIEHLRKVIMFEIDKTVQKIS